MSELWAAVRGKAPQPKAKIDPFFFAMTSGYSTARSTPKTSTNFSKLRAMSESAIPRRAISYIKDQVSMLDWEIRLKNGKQPNDRQKQEIARIKQILCNPNPQDTWRGFIEQVVEDMLVMGAGAIEMRAWDSNPDQPMVMYPVDAASIEVFMDWDGSPNTPRYAQRDARGDYITFTPRELLYVRMNKRTSTPFGLGPLEVAIDNVDALLAAGAYAKRTASTAYPDRALDLGEEVTDDHVRMYRMYWNDEIEGRGKMPIIGGTKNAKSIQLAAADDNGLFLKWQSFLIVQIANAFGIDPMKFGALIGVTHASADVLDDSTDESAIRPLGHTLEATINSEILHPLGFDDYEFYYLWTSSNEDRKSLAAIHQVYLQMNTLMIDEVRSELGKPPLPEGKGRMTMAEHLAIYGGNNHVLGPDVDPDAGPGKFGDNGNLGPTQLNNNAKNAQDPTQNPNAANQTNRSGQSAKITTRGNKPMNQGRDNMKIQL